MSNASETSNVKEPTSQVSELKTAIISVKGRNVIVPALQIQHRTIVAIGRHLKVAELKSHDWVSSLTEDEVSRILSEIRARHFNADILSFAQDLDNIERIFPYPVHWEDWAAIPITNYADWWDALPQESRKNVRRAEKRGLIAKWAPFDDALVRGIKTIYDENPIRQGRKFWHYGKPSELVRKENESFLERSDFITAYHQDELVGFVKIVHVGKIARIMQILSKNAHFDKRPANLLLAKTVEICCEKKASHLVYGRYFYGNKGHTPITEFKRRNGFLRIAVPRYYVPLSIKGRMAMKLHLHRGLKNLVPQRATNLLLALRNLFYRFGRRTGKGLPASESN